MKWSISIGPAGPWRKPHRYQVLPPEECGCGWVCTDMDAAMRLVDLFTFARRYPDVFVLFIEDEMASASYRRHYEHLKLAMQREKFIPEYDSEGSY